MLFCAAQAPELFGRDQRYGVLPLYFSRVLTRPDYALAKVGGLIAALLIVELSPYIILFVGRVLVAPDPVAGLTDEISAVPRVPAPGAARRGPARRDRRADRGLDAASCVRHGGDHRGLHHPADHRGHHRDQASEDFARIAVFLSPSDILDGTNAAIFGSIPDSPVVASLALPGWAYLVAAVVGIARVDRPDRPALSEDRGMTDASEPTAPAPTRPTRAAPPAPTAPAAGRGPRPTAALEVDHVSRWYGNVVAVNDISFGLGAGRDRPARAERRRQVDAPAPDGRPPRAVGRPRPRPGRDAPGAGPRCTATSGSSPSARPSTRT